MYFLEKHLHDDGWFDYQTYRNTARMVREQAKTNYYLDEMQRERQIQEKLRDILTRHMLMMDLIDGVKDPLLQCHLYISLFYGREEDFDVLVAELDSMDDRKETMAQQARLKAMGERLNAYREQYVASPLKRLFDEIKNYLEEKEAPNKLPYIPTPIVFKPTLPMHPGFYEFGLAMVAMGGIAGILFFALLAVANHDDPAAVVVGTAFAVFSAIIMAVGLPLLSRGRKRSKAARAIPATMTDSEKQYLEAKQRQNEQKKEMVKALLHHPIFAHIAMLKEAYPEYVPSWDRIKSLEKRMGENLTSEANKFIRM